MSINGVPININGISTFCDIKRETLKKHIRKLEELEVLKRVKSGRNTNILINPYFIGYGKDNTSDALDTFSKSVWANCSKYKKRKRENQSG